MKKPFLLIIAGPNGSGKTTYHDNNPVFEGLPFVNADKIAERFNSIGAQETKIAQDEAQDKIADFFRERRSFCFETVFSHASKIELIEKAKGLGYLVSLHVLLADDPQLNVLRVKRRFLEGGHDVPTQKILSRRPRTLRNIKEAMLLVHSFVVVDTTHNAGNKLLANYNGTGVKTEAPRHSVENPTFGENLNSRAVMIAMKARVKDFINLVAMVDLISSDEILLKSLMKIDRDFSSFSKKPPPSTRRRRPETSRIGREGMNCDGAFLKSDTFLGMDKQILTYRFRLKDGNKVKVLKTLSSQTNFVWNVCNDVIRENWKRSRKYTHKSDLNKITRGASKELDINSQTVQAVANELLLRVQKCKKKIRFRTAKGGKNLGWVPFNGQTIKFHGGYIDYNGFRFRLWQHRSLPQSAVIKTGSFSEDARGRWYVNLVIEIDDEEYARPSPKTSSIVAIDPGMKTVMTTSDGEKFERDNLTKVYAEKLAKAQRHHKKKQVKKIHAKIKNRRLDFSHKATEKLASQYELIFFGDASSKKFVKTKMAKGVTDAAWGQIKTFLAYKTIRRQGRMLLINEKFSTVTCSVCLERSGPSGLSGLGIREWKCSVCSSVHDRDLNAARNILRLGHKTLSPDLGSV